MYRVVPLVLLTCLAAGCQSRQTPAGPSSERPVAGVIAGAVPQSFTGQTVPWSCLVASLDRSVYGIFSSVRATCPAPPVHGQSIRTSAPASAPSSPIFLTSSVINSTVILFWTAPAGPDPVSSYVVEAGSAPGLVNLANFDTGTPAPTLTASNVPPGTYFVRVRAKNSSGVSAPSNETVLTVGGGGSGCGAVPDPPTSLMASSSGSSVTLSWAAPSGGCAPQTYFIEAGSAPGRNDLADFSTLSTSTVFSAGGVGNGTYFVRVRSATSAGKSAPSNEATLVVGQQMPACGGSPTNLTSSVSGNTASVLWSDPSNGSPSSYVVEIGTSPGAANTSVTTVGLTPRIFSATLPAGTYFIRMKANYACGTSAASSDVTVTIIAANNTPPVAAFIVIRNPDTVGLAGVNEGKCAASQITGTTSNLLRCTFDGSASTPNPGITKYEWTIVSPDNKFSGQTVPAAQVPCGSFGGTESERTVTLTVTSPGGSNTATKQVTFVKAAAC